jgi:hypothetical protein
MEATTVLEEEIKNRRGPRAVWVGAGRRRRWEAASRIRWTTMRGRPPQMGSGDGGGGVDGTGGEHGDVGARWRLRREVAALGEATARLGEAAARLRWGCGGAVWGGGGAIKMQLQVYNTCGY